MSSRAAFSQKDSLNKTRNAILRIKNCSPKLKTILRQRCQKRIQNERSKLLNTLRKISCQGSIKEAISNLISEEWINIENEELHEEPERDTVEGIINNDEFNIDEELLLEELLEKELLREHDEWLMQKYEELLNEELLCSNDVVCPLCCSGFLESKHILNSCKVKCNKCLESFLIEKSLLDLQAAIYECLSWHDKHCKGNPGFVSILKNEKDNNLCIVCDQCSFIKVLA